MSAAVTRTVATATMGTTVNFGKLRGPGGTIAESMSVPKFRGSEVPGFSRSRFRGSSEIRTSEPEPRNPARENLGTPELRNPGTDNRQHPGHLGAGTMRMYGFGDFQPEG